MKTSKALILGVLIVAAVVVLQLGKKKGQVANINMVEGTTVPAFTFTDSGGKAVTYDAFKGKPLIINFWATWCPSCKDEIPSLQSFYNDEKSGQNVNIVTVLFRDDMSSAQSFMKKHKYDFPVYTDSSGAARSFGLTGVPETYLIDKNGIVVRRILGPLDWQTSSGKELLSELLSRI
ncbi:MAG: TlpA family protein disulfide reductase [Nitrospirae bacterium]|nr:TlpA family protein disulfide reductase [Nitrospirota bacterium]MBF0520844.1 TlpA family protein disulfide reductase [Nitrospirota bacterium]MBF0533925.1 TlpA family protein disulfide reductase [Nitrospirota bacterium]MBF0618037.1 TlpA family protein disulfide reductase [Nitrospirota bacterium]